MDHTINSITNIIDLVIYLVTSFGLMKLYQKANLANTWLAFIPLVQYIPLLHAIDKSGWNVLWIFVPIAGIVFFIIWYVKFLQAFNAHGAHVVGWILVPLYIPIHIMILANSNEVKYTLTRQRYEV